MFGIHHFGLFLAAGFLLNLTPGPDTLYILGRSMAQGREAGVASAFGISLGSIFHTFAAAFGLSAILASSAQAFAASDTKNMSPFTRIRSTAARDRGQLSRPALDI